MAFTPEQKRTYYRANPEKVALYSGRWQRRHPTRAAANVRRWRATKKRRDEITGAKHILLSAHRLRAIGVVPRLAPHFCDFDSWEVRPASPWERK